ncbi:MAG: CpsD/CapB family tyrosine-protein kinase [Chloroflexi bacterium]|nr:CpsD/CapB family tyrosine-protein kinase [Chloroflexota bacterium]
MAIIRRAKKEPPFDSLVLPGGDGNPVQVFDGVVVERLRQMVTRMNRTSGLPKCLALVAALRHEGVTFNSHALGVVMAHDLGARVCVVELNWWWPSQSPFVAPDNEGLAAVITNKAVLEDVVAPTGWSNFSYLPAGVLEKRDRPVMARSQVMHNILHELQTRFDFLILDVPALRATSDAVPLASLATACVLVIHQGVTVVEDVRLALDDIDHMEVKGVILNRNKIATPGVISRLLSI